MKCIQSFKSTSSFCFLKKKPRHGESWRSPGWWQQRGHHQPFLGPGAASGGPPDSGQWKRRVAAGGDTQCGRGEGDPGPRPGALPAESCIWGDPAEPQQQHAGPERELRLCLCVWQVYQVRREQRMPLPPSIRGTYTFVLQGHSTKFDWVSTPSRGRKCETAALNMSPSMITM